MSSLQNGMIPRHIQIPKPFHSEVTGKLFETCIHCNRHLLDSNLHYVIEKVIKYYDEMKTTDTIFEYAVCLNCYQELRKSLSNESIQRLGTYLQNHVNLEARRQKFIENEDLDVSHWIGHCIIMDKPIQKCREYQIMCECVGDRMLFTLMPYMICDDAIEEMSELLSEKTQGFFDDFRKRFLGPPPEVSELLKSSRVLFL
jgi:hypothetical protein